MIIKYKIEKFNCGRPLMDIIIVECTKETKKSIWIKERVSRKETGYTYYHDSFKDAHKHLIKMSNIYVNKKEKEYKEAVEIKNKIEKLME